LKLRYLVLRTRTAWATSLAAIVLLGDQPAMPGQERCGVHNRGQFMKHAPAQFLGSDRQTPSLVVIEPQSLASQLFAEHTVLFLKIVDDV